jgi:putative tryptophan/tyrosine transport system substrate-binding protein
MRRREFVTLFGGAAAWPLAARAQQQAMPVIVYFSAGTREDLSSEAAAFRLGLLRSGFIDGRNVVIEYHFADNQFDRLPAMARGLVARRPAVIAAGPRAAQAAKAATSTIPIVFWIGGDPVTLGLVDSINRPSGNVTGVSILSSEITAKRLGLMHQAIPTATTIGFLLDPNAGAADTVRRQEEAAGNSLGVALRVVEATDRGQIEAAFAAFATEDIRAVFVANSLLFLEQRQRLADLEARYRIPASYELRAHVDAGSFMSYGARDTDAYQQMGVYVARILNGAKSTDLPVMLPARFEFVLNLKVVKSLGLTIPPGVLAIVDDVIE